LGTTGKQRANKEDGHPQGHAPKADELHADAPETHHGPNTQQKTKQEKEVDETATGGQGLDVGAHRLALRPEIHGTQEDSGKQAYSIGCHVHQKPGRGAKKSATPVGSGKDCCKSRRMIAASDTGGMKRRVGQACGDLFQIATIFRNEVGNRMYGFPVAPLAHEPARAFGQLHASDQKKCRDQCLGHKKEAPDLGRTMEMEQAQDQQSGQQHAHRLTGDGGHHHASAAAMGHAFSDVTAAHREIHADGDPHEGLSDDQEPRLPG